MLLDFTAGWAFAAVGAVVGAAVWFQNVIGWW